MAEGDIQSLLHEGRAIQCNLTRHAFQSVSDQSHFSCVFACLVHQGQVRAALRMLDNPNMGRGGVLPLDHVGPETRGKSVSQVLKEKDPKAERPAEEILLNPTGGPKETYHPVIFQRITAALIGRTVLRVQGAANLSGLEANIWRRFCVSFG